MGKSIVNIIDFGAASNTCELQTKNIQNAIDECFKRGGGEVVVPEGVFMTGGIRLRSNVALHLLKNAVLKGSRNPEDYFSCREDELEPINEYITDAKWISVTAREKESDYDFMRRAGSRWHNGLIRALNAENIAIIAEEGAVIDGSNCFDEIGEENYRGPHCISMYNCKNISFKGYTVKDSANWAHTLFYCDNINMENVTVLAGHDGIHMTVCRNITIDNCTFHTGDDCVAGFSNVNMTVSRCVLNSACSAMRMGGTNVLVENCHIYGPCKHLYRGSLTQEEKKQGINPRVEGHRNNMLSVFTYYADFTFPIKHQPGNIIIKDCTVDYADRFLHFNFSGNEMWQSNRPLESIRFENIKATGISMPLIAYGDKDIPVTLELVNVDISMRESFEKTDFIHAANYKKILLENVNVGNYQGECLVKSWTSGDVQCKNVNCGISEDRIIMQTEEEFVCGPI